MSFMQSLRMALSAIWSNKMRSFLTMLGVIIGVFAVVVLVSLGEGATGQITSEFEKMGTNFLSASITNPRYGLSDEDIQKIGEIENVKSFAPMLQSSVTVRAEGETMNVTLYGSTEQYLAVQEQLLESGRNLTTMDLENRFMVAIIGTEVADEIFGYRDVIGQTLKINGRSVKVVGIVEEQEDSMMGSANEFIVVPLDTAQRLLKTKDVRAMSLRAETPEDVVQIKREAETQMTKMVGKDNYSIFSSQDMLDSLNSAMGTMTLMLGGIAAISLLVGGIGIMNIMLVSVTERTREIGIRKAIGAKRKDILLQFLIEAVVITMIGGVFALITSQLALTLLGDYMGFDLAMSTSTVALGLGFCLAIGLLFGVYPANKASKLNPIEALRHE